MYSTCIFCNRPLGANEVLEHFPVGRRLAFDAARGRLWVVCSKCERWNLSPLETRWEAIEDAERVYRSTRLRVSTDNIGLAQTKEGLELVRIGKPPNLELAGWRYGDQFGRRRRKYAVAGTLVGAATVAAATLSLTGVAFAGLGVQLLYQTGQWIWLFRYRRQPRAFVRDDAGKRLLLTRENTNAANLVANRSDGSWRLRLQHSEPAGPESLVARLSRSATDAKRPTDAILTGTAAQQALGVLLPHINAAGGSRRGIREAVGVIERHETADQLVYSAAAMRSYNNFRPGENAVAGLPRSVRLALEMVLHENEERRALEGELSTLERRWREAEEIARIADSLLQPPDLDERLERLRDGTRLR